jgi:hypothetical protein
MKTGSLTITPEILRLIAEIDEFKGSWRTLTTLNPERLSVLKRVATIESIGSSTRIEGAKLTDREVEELLGRLERQDFVSRDEQEVAGYAEVMDTVFDSYADIPVTENYIKQLHAMLLRHSTKDSRHRGEYKKLPNNVEAFDKRSTQTGRVSASSSLRHRPSIRPSGCKSWSLGPARRSMIGPGIRSSSSGCSSSSFWQSIHSRMATGGSRES